MVDTCTSADNLAYFKNPPPSVTPCPYPSRHTPIGSFLLPDIQPRIPQDVHQGVVCTRKERRQAEPVLPDVQSSRGAETKSAEEAASCRRRRSPSPLPPPRPHAQPQPLPRPQSRTRPLRHQPIAKRGSRGAAEGGHGRHDHAGAREEARLFREAVQPWWAVTRIQQRHSTTTAPKANQLFHQLGRAQRPATPVRRQRRQRQHQNAQSSGKPRIPGWRAPRALQGSSVANV